MPCNARLDKAHQLLHEVPQVTYKRLLHAVGLNDVKYFTALLTKRLALPQNRSKMTLNGGITPILPQHCHKIKIFFRW